MLQTKALIRFFAVLMLCWVVLFLVPGFFPAVGRGYANVFRTVNNVLLARFWVWPDGQVVFMDLDAEDLKDQIQAHLPRPLPAQWRAPARDRLSKKETLMVLKHRRVPGAIGLLRTSAEHLGYWPTALLIALIIAKPLPWQRKAWALVCGLILIHLFIAWRLSLTIAENGFALEEKQYHLFTLTEAWMQRLSSAVQVFVHNPTVGFMVAILIWFIVGFTKDDWAQFSKRNGDELAEEATS